MRSPFRLTLPLFASLGLLLSACGPSPEERPEASTAAPAHQAPTRPAAAPTSAPAPDACPAQAEAPALMPGLRAEQTTLAYWLDQMATRHDLDEVLLRSGELERINRAAHSRPHGPDGRVEEDLDQPLTAERIEQHLDERLGWMREQAQAKRHLEPGGEPLSAQALALYARPEGWRPAPGELRVALDFVPIRCAPRTAPLLGPSLDPDFDRNNCSGVHAQELIEDFGPFGGTGLRLVRSRYTIGFVPEGAPLSPPLPHAQGRALFAAPRLQAMGDVPLTGEDGARFTLPDGRFVAVEAGEGGAPQAVLFATAAGLHRGPVPAQGLRATQRPLTRRALFEEAFRWLGSPYGWGDERGGRDCSRYLLDIFESFGLKLPRHSAHQPQVASFAIDLREVKGEQDRLHILDEAEKHGIVLLQFPGHIMLYLGRDEAGRPMAIHSFAEYLVPCGAGVQTQNEARETLMRVHQVQVSDLELGRGSSRTAFIERITSVGVIGKRPGPSLEGLAVQRPAAPVQAPKSCKSARRFPLFVSPERPVAGEPVRVVGVAFEAPGPLEAAVKGPDGRTTYPALRALGGPPFGRVLQLERPQAGEYTVALGDGDQVETCVRFRVHPTGQRAPAPEQGAWPVRDAWGPQMERFFAIFVESLFDYPLDEELTWPNLHSLLQDPVRNLLYDHLEPGEERRLRMQPDCADLPYFLRAYFAWKMGLPMGWRQCTRGRDDRAVQCGPLQSQDQMAGRGDAFSAATTVIRRTIKSAAHSSSARTRPDDDESDSYPIPLTREALRPGTTYADPYGHLLVITKWVAQTATSPGYLMAADAQPDGLIGRRRFWQGSFLFSSDTTYLGAGFKAFRPVVMRDGQARVLTNEELRNQTAFVEWSEDQYRAGDLGFYDRVEALANPRPLNASVRQAALAEALHEVVSRRVSAVQMGEDFMRRQGGRTMVMPKGSNIFLTSGPWEDFATPSRDLRLLVSIHTFLDFPESVLRGPERFGLSAQEAPAVVEALRAEAKAQLEAATIAYEGSDGRPVTLNLQQVIDRRRALEMAYNPNDCMEIRWGAPEDSEEMARCTRRAPAAQRKQMQQYRHWFKDRKRPAR